MSFIFQKGRQYWVTSRGFLRVLFLILVACLSFAALVFPLALRPSSFPLKFGDVASQDILAPRAFTYISNYLTEQDKKAAMNAVQPVYLAADPGITRSQIEKLRVSLDYIDNVRQDTYANQDQKVSDLGNLQNIQLSKDTGNKIMALSETRWQAVQQEALNVLEEAMRNSIRQDQVADAQRNVPPLISFSLPQDEASIVSDLVIPFVVPNSLYSDSQTTQARQTAGNSVKPVSVSFASGESIVRRGQVISLLNLEALQQFGLIQPQQNNQDIVATTALVILLSGFIGLYFNRRKGTAVESTPNLILISITFLVFLVGARLIIPNRTVVPYLYPLSAFGMTIASMFTMEIGLVLSLVLGILTAYGLPNGLELTLFYILSSLCGILLLGNGRRVANFFWAGIVIGVAGCAVLLAFRLTSSITDWVGIATLGGASLISGIASAGLTMLFQFLFSQLLGLTTSLQLLEISRPDHPLLQFVLRNAPGTYQHSLQVANIAEQAAEDIGADALLVRVGALYHDAGKAVNPLFFVENQVPGKLNPHDDLDPVTSAATIIQHITDGINLARKYHLPPRIQDFIREHHGTLFTRYQYTKAVQAAGNNPEGVNQDLFRYPGPKPKSRETALIMLADGCEARARAELPKDEEELRIMVKKVFDFVEREGQLDNTTFTFKDLNKSSESFINTLKNTYHPRLQYPELKSVTNTSETGPIKTRDSETDSPNP
ncbi:MAG: HDIG domain-containing protein [Anaerolineaceae bacterium]|nr:HDIG domain-containing protein [Anaerolineaceae bacterium]